MYKKNKVQKAFVVLSLALVLSLAGTSGCAFFEDLNPNQLFTESEAKQSNPGPLPDLASAIAYSRLSVVSINTVWLYVPTYGTPYTTSGAASGWILTHDGYIVTNSHVVKGALSVSVSLEDGRIFEVDVEEQVFTDSFTDLAVIKIDAVGLPVAKVGDSDRLQVGDWVVALGNSLGLGISATKGIVSATGVAISVSDSVYLYNLIQTDAAINNGNSGGPLINLYGEVIGITSAKVSKAGVEGMGYAISITGAMDIISLLISDGKIVRPDVGALLITNNPSYASIYQLPLLGALVQKVSPNGPFSKAGIRAGDAIVAIDDITIDSAEGFRLILQSFEVNQEVTITYYRKQEKRITTVILGEAV